jgi:hypothetical protein
MPSRPTLVAHQIFTLRFVADLHIHRYALVTSRELHPENQYKWAALKALLS